MGVASCLPSVRNLFSRGNTTSAIVAPPPVSGSHVVKIDGYSRTKGLGNGVFIKSETFEVGGHGWCLYYYPDGETSDSADYISTFLGLHHSNANKVRAEFKFSLLDQDSQPVPSHSRRSSQIHIFSHKETWGFDLIERKVLEKSLCLRDDVFRIWCEVTVMKEIFTEPIPPPLVVPPSNMHRHLGQLLLAGEATDVTFEVGAASFPAHRCILAARSSVFKAELLGPMKENIASHVQIDDMDVNVFKVLLHFIYTDSLPELDEDDTVAMCQHLLVAADRYNLERLKLICEEKLCNNICKRTAATTLTLAEQHGCDALKKECFKFLTSPGNLKAVMASDGYQHLRSSCPSVIEELLAKLAP
jgi:speckle-type POZ protein